MDGLTLIYFSPTGTTKKVMLAIAKGLNLPIVEKINLTKKKVRDSLQELSVLIPQEKIVLIGVPVYEEKIPTFIEPLLEKLEGSGRQCILIAVYGNVGEGITLKQLAEIMIARKFTVLAAGSFIGEHSFSHETFTVAKNRPDDTDLKIAYDFGKKISQNLDESQENSSTEFQLSSLPIKFPLLLKIGPKNMIHMVSKQPAVDINLCNHCNICFHKCPMKAIDNETLQIHEKSCIRCYTCVRVCPQHARHIEFKKKKIVERFLQKAHQKRRDPRLYF
jgi:ferredoxin/flavodoxin